MLAFNDLWNSVRRLFVLLRPLSWETITKERGILQYTVYSRVQRIFKGSMVKLTYFRMNGRFPRKRLPG